MINRKFENEGHLAQLVERFAYNEMVSGSSPLLPTHNAADMVKQVDTPGLGPGAFMLCRFKSCYP